jgi:hypothetical protein
VPIVRGIQLVLQLFLGAVLCAAALVLSYRARVYYIKTVSAVVHAPYFVFGQLIRFLMKRLGVRLEDVYGRR